MDTTLEVSFDDHTASPFGGAASRGQAPAGEGARWSRVPVIRFGDQALAVILNQPGARFVSLRGTASDALGNKVEQTIIRAYGLAP